MRKIIDFGKIDFDGVGRKRNLVQIDIELRDNGKGVAVLSICGDVWNDLKTDIVCGGQCLDTILPFFKNNELFLKIHRWWKLYHLNDLHGGTPAQEKAIKEHFGEGYQIANSYRAVCEYLKSIDLYEDNGYRYGSAWLTEEIPVDDLEEIKTLISQ